MRLLLILSLLAALPVANTLHVSTPTWSAPELRILASLPLSAAGSPPPSPSNQYADNPAAAAFGKRLFYDLRFSGNSRISCASCHQPQRYFSDGLARGIGTQQLIRNTPSVVGAAYQRWFYWDGRRDSLWAQALVPFEVSAEMNSSRLMVLHQIAGDASLRRDYQQLFGALPAALTGDRLPRHATPLGKPVARSNWQRLAPALRYEINAAYANLGKALAAYQRTLRPPSSRFDDYVDALSAGERPPPWSADELAGLKLFIDADRTRCLQCHNGPLLSNGGFHNIGTGNFDDDHFDFGRALGLRAVLIDEFNCLGPYSDAQPEQCSALRFLSHDRHASLKGAFKVPSLRNLAATAPYFHDGRFADLLDVMRYYRRPPPDRHHELQPLDLNERELRQLISFLLTLTASVDSNATNNFKVQ